MYYFILHTFLTALKYVALPLVFVIRQSSALDRADLALRMKKICESKHIHKMIETV